MLIIKNIIACLSLFTNIIGAVMGKSKVLLMPRAEKNLLTFGENIKLYRLRRKWSVELIAERAKVSRSTVWAIEKGSPSVSMGAYTAVLHALGGLDRELAKIGADDPVGRNMQDAGIMPRKRAPKRDRDE